jgi:hypothetical protein
MSGISHIARAGTMTIAGGLRQRFSAGRAPVDRQGLERCWWDGVMPGIMKLARLRQPG